MPKAVFAGCARSCAPFLDAVLANVEALGSTYDSFDLVIVENDSGDDTRERLERFAEGRGNVRLIVADGLATAHPKRTDRIAAARNLYMEVLAEPRYADVDDLVILDFDDVNCRPLDAEAFAAARAWLWKEADRRAVFANASLFYYDIWALRHPSWSPDDCWARVRASQAALGRPEAVRRHVAARQIPISPTAAPIPVDSAFGGLAIYRKQATLGATYVGLDPHGEEVCEHVGFNAAVKGEDGLLAIFPALQNHAPRPHIMSALGGARAIDLEQGGRRCRLAGPADHPLQKFREAHPLYDRRLPVLAEILSRHAPDASFIDVGANIGDGVALARLAGARMPAIAIEASLTYCKYLWANMERLPRLFERTRLVWGYAGASGAEGRVALGAGTGSAAGAASVTAVESAPGVQLERLAGDLDVSLFKTDTDGFDQDIVAAELKFLEAKEPVLWLEAQTMSAGDEAKWSSLFRSMAEKWPKLVIFDNFGFALATSDTADLGAHAVELMAYGRRQRERPSYRPTLYYIDVALFPRRFEAVYEEFCRSIAELSA